MTKIATAKRSPEIDMDTIETSILLAKEYASEAIKVIFDMPGDSDLWLSLRTLAWIRAKFPSQLFSLPEVYENGPKGVRHNPNRAKEIMSFLVDCGYLTKFKNGVTIDGVHRRDVFLALDLKD